MHKKKLKLHITNRTSKCGYKMKNALRSAAIAFRTSKCGYQIPLPKPHTVFFLSRSQHINLPKPSTMTTTPALY
ncbi:hypothetical protein VIGAN_01470400 [Vigna angularis var. angularis]|uniref:Uncharacterized protein n=1 Tax=Vigna angularis var. angularis TaxID=157739 RepID=A0A0S3R7P9_PHAAN|nr:hypothetical protein VIGAN_01470400 [Vigna angularis var. angularis]